MIILAKHIIDEAKHIADSTRVRKNARIARNRLRSLIKQNVYGRDDTYTIAYESVIYADLYDYLVEVYEFEILESYKYSPKVALSTKLISEIVPRILLFRRGLTFRLEFDKKTKEFTFYFCTRPWRYVVAKLLSYIYR